MISPGWLICTCHNYGDYKLAYDGSLWERVGFGFWRCVIDSGIKVKTLYSLSSVLKYANHGFRCGLKLQKGGLWVGAHYSPNNRRWCINLIPCVTVWIALKGGRVPD